MSRRRPSLRTYVRRRWRALGLIVVALLGAQLLLTISDRGHDPLWEFREPYVDQVALSPDGAFVYALVRDAENGPLVRLEARSGADGSILWKTDLDATRGLLAAGESGVAIATDFPRAFLTYHGTDGRVRYHLALDGTPRAMGVDRSRVAVALQDRVLHVVDGEVTATTTFGGFVNALDARAGRLAVGTSQGRVAVLEADGTVRLDETLPMNVRSLRLSGDADFLIAGGVVPANLTGLVAFLDVAAPRPVLWTQRTAIGVGLVDLDERGLRAIAVEDPVPGYALRVYDTLRGAQTWGKLIEGSISRDDAGAYGSVALAPDGSVVAVGTLAEGIRVYEGDDGGLAWRYRSDGTTLVTFRREDPALFAANARLVPNGPPSAVLLFSPAEEPLTASYPAATAMLVAVAALGAVAMVGVGYWRVRRSY